MALHFGHVEAMCMVFICGLLVAITVYTWLRMWVVTSQDVAIVGVAWPFWPSFCSTENII